MAKIHLLVGGNGSYTVVVHTATPVGNNSAGVPWSTALVNAGRAKTVMTIGTGAGQITQVEADAIAAGTTIEGSFTWDDVPGATGAELIADVDLRANQLVNERIAQLSSQLKYFGYTRP